ncbi:MAG: DAK2 domain-containing protein [Anaerolineae bacterium]
MTTELRTKRWELPRRRNRPILACDGQELKLLLKAGLAWLEKHSGAINALNVFPVPDGDTGTNMVLTMQAAYKEIAQSPEHSVSAIAQAVAQGALMGARGNSGVILSQLFRGMARSLDGKRRFDANDFAVATQEAAHTAYQGVIKPVEGTILTVAREIAEASVNAAAESDDLYEMLVAIVERARQAVAETPSLLPVLEEAGVVDAGGQGLFIILQGALRLLQGESVDTDAELEEVADLSVMGKEGGYGYDIQFVLRGKDLNLEEIRERIASMGESALVVGDSDLIKVHVHAPRPGAILDYGASLGSMSKIVVENMQEQYQEFMTGQARPSVTTEEITNIATVAVAPGAGLMRVFESLGASAVVPGGQTMNPSTEELLEAIESLAADKVIVLPNNKNIILTAEQAKRLSSKKVEVVSSKTVPQGISALLAFNFQADLEDNVRAMERALEEIQTGEITTAIRSVQINGIEVKEGEVIGLCNGALAASGHDVDEVGLEILKQMKTEEYEIVTVYFGEGMKPDEAEAFAQKIRQAYPEQEVEVIEGGQPHYHYIMSAE